MTCEYSDYTGPVIVRWLFGPSGLLITNNLDDLDFFVLLGVLGTPSKNVVQKFNVDLYDEQEDGTLEYTFNEDGDIIKVVKNITWTDSHKVEKDSYEYTLEWEDGPAPATGIYAISSTITDSETVYNLQGQRVGKDYRGVVIQNGRKYLQK